MRTWLKVIGVLVLVVTSSIALLIFYLPSHWMREMSDFATVTVDGRTVPADAYLGNPTTNEADAFLLVRVPGEGNFLFNLLDEDFREISSDDFVRLYRGAIMIRRMSGGPWTRPSPSVKINQFRVVSQKRHTVIVQF